MKRKFIILTLCFTIVFSSLNYKKSYADGGIISAPILATVVTAALGTGIVLKNSDEIYNLGRMFYDYVQNNNSIMWDTVVSSFESSVAFNSLTKQVTIGKEFGGILKGFFDDTFDSSLPSDIGESFVGSSLGIPLYDNKIIVSNKQWPLSTSIGVEIPSSYFDGEIHKFGDFYLQYPSGSKQLQIFYNDTTYYITLFSKSLSSPVYILMTYDSSYKKFRFVLNTHYSSNDFRQIHNFSQWFALPSVVSIPYNGTYNPGNVWGDTEEGIKDVPIYVPGDLSDILNGNPSDVVGDKAPSWVGDGTVSVPSVDNPSIGVSDDAFVNSGVVDKPTDTPTDTPTDKPSWLPSFPSFGEELDFSPLYMTNIKDKFPFSLPWDFKNLINMFDVKPVAPKFEVPFLGNNITLDFSYFEEWATIIRFFILISFNVTLIFISTKLKG